MNPAPRQPLIVAGAYWAIIGDANVFAVRTRSGVGAIDPEADHYGPPEVVVDGRTLPVRLHEHGSLRRDGGWSRLIIPADTDAVVFRWSRSMVTGYRLREPDEAPRNLADRITVDEWQALYDQDEDYDDRRSSSGQYTAEHTQLAPYVLTVPVAVLRAAGKLLPASDYDDAAAAGFTDQELADWTPDPVWVEMFGEVFGPWLPGSIRYRGHLYDRLAAAGYPVPDRHFSQDPAKVTVDVHVPYDPPRSERVKPGPQRGRRKAPATALMRAIDETVKVPVNVPERLSYRRGLAAALIGRDRHVRAWLDHFAEVGAWHTCSHCDGLGVVHHLVAPPER